MENPVADVIIGNIDGASMDRRQSAETAGAVQTRKAASENNYKELTKSRVERPEQLDSEKVKALNDFSTEEIKSAQANDESLRATWEKVMMERPDDRDSWITVKDGLLCRMKEVRGGQDMIEQLIAPQKFRQKIM